MKNDSQREQRSLSVGRVMFVDRQEQSVSSLVSLYLLQYLVVTTPVTQRLKHTLKVMVNSSTLLWTLRVRVAIV